MTDNLEVDEKALGHLMELDIADHVLGLSDTEFQRMLPTLQQATAEGDRQAVARLAHRMRGTALQVGATSMATELKRVELAARDGLEMVDVDGLSDRWAECFVALMHLVKARP